MDLTPGDRVVVPAPGPGFEPGTYLAGETVHLLAADEWKPLPVKAVTPTVNAAEWEALRVAVYRAGEQLVEALQPSIDALRRLSGTFSAASDLPRMNYDGQDVSRGDTFRPPADPRLRGSAPFARRGRR